jgi:hypothetical protein
MSNFKEDTDNNLRTTIFLILFSLIVFVSANNRGNYYSSVTENTTQTAFVFGYISSHHNNILCNTDKLPDLQKHYVWAINKTSLHPFSIHYIISDYNHRIAQNLIQIQNSRLTIEPLLLWRLYDTLSASATGDLPVLS